MISCGLKPNTFYLIVCVGICYQNAWMKSERDTLSSIAAFLTSAENCSSVIHIVNGSTERSIEEILPYRLVGDRISRPVHPVQSIRSMRTSVHLGRSYLPRPSYQIPELKREKKRDHYGPMSLWLSLTA